MKLAIIAGGKGTRLGLTTIPKPMATVAEKPILEHQILLARQHGITDITILSGHLSECIQEYFQDGSRWGVHITHLVEPAPLGTAGAVKLLKGRVAGRFLVFFGDVFIDMDLDALLAFDAQTDSPATILVHPNNHPYDSDLVEVNERHEVVAFHSKPHPEGFVYHNLVNAGVCLLHSEIFDLIPDDRPSDFGKHIFPAMLQAGKTIRAYASPEYVKDMGTIDRLEKVRQEYASGKVQRLNRKNPQRAIFLDRDGVINREVGNISHPDQFELLPGVAQAVRAINESGYLSIVITNQPVIAKGFCTVTGLAAIHKKMETLLGNDRAYLDSLFYCPHHPEKGFPGELPELKIECDCRKPRPGLLLQAQQKFGICLEDSYFIGDRFADIQAGKNAGVKTVLLETGHAGADAGQYSVQPDRRFPNLFEAVTQLLGEKP
jgi:D,D-heptose 1,7-bisphosphate phosphatase